MTPDAAAAPTPNAPEARAPDAGPQQMTGQADPAARAPGAPPRGPEGRDAPWIFRDLASI